MKRQRDGSVNNRQQPPRASASGFAFGTDVVVKLSSGRHVLAYIRAGPLKLPGRKSLFYEVAEPLKNEYWFSSVDRVSLRGSKLAKRRARAAKKRQRAEARAAEKRLQKEREAEQREAEQREAEQREAEQRAADLRSALALRAAELEAASMSPGAAISTLPTSPSPEVLRADPPLPCDFLATEGYVFLRSVVPECLCAKTCAAIESDLEDRLSMGSRHQEEPVENLTMSTNAVMLELQSWVVDNVLRPRFCPTACVPSCWTQTLYGRLKKRNFRTKFHCDALNTVVERRLLSKLEPKWLERMGLRDIERHRRNWDSFIRDEGSISCSERLELPIFTFWVCLRSLESPRQSHLRIHPKSHLGEGFTRTSCKVGKQDYKYQSKNFAGPEWPRGYEIGDLVVFHCLTQHEATVHDEQVKGGLQGIKYPGTDLETDNSLPTVRNRVSMDGRVFMSQLKVTELRNSVPVIPVGSDVFARFGKQRNVKAYVRAGPLQLAGKAHHLFFYEVASVNNSGYWFCPEKDVRIRKEG